MNLFRVTRALCNCAFNLCMAYHYGHLIICVSLSNLMQYKRTALHMACISGHVEVAATLLTHGANVDKEDAVRL